MGYSPWGRKELDVTEQLAFTVLNSYQRNWHMSLCFLSARLARVTALLGESSMISVTSQAGGREGSSWGGAEESKKQAGGQAEGPAGWPEGRKCSGTLKARAWCSTIPRAGAEREGEGCG